MTKTSTNALKALPVVLLCLLVLVLLTVYAQSTKTVTLTWDPVSAQAFGVSSITYDVWRIGPTTDVTVILAKDLTVTTVTYSLPLTDTTAYQYKIVARCYSTRRCGPLLRPTVKVASP